MLLLIVCGDRPAPRLRLLVATVKGITVVNWNQVFRIYNVEKRLKRIQQKSLKAVKMYFQRRCEVDLVDEIKLKLNYNWRTILATSVPLLGHFPVFDWPRSTASSDSSMTLKPLMVKRRELAPRVIIPDVCFRLHGRPAVCVNVSTVKNHNFLPNKILMASVDQNTDFPLLDRATTEGGIFVCQNYTCQLPVQTVAAFEALVARP